MRLLITGMHRSGNSAISRMLHVGSGLSLLDDPEWAVANPLLYRNSDDRRDELVRSEIVKCPRMAGVLTEVLGDFRNTKAVWVARDPRDVLSSILEKVRRGRRTSMLSFPEIGLPEYGIECFSKAYVHYIRTLIDAKSTFCNNIHIVSYDEFFFDRMKVMGSVSDFASMEFCPERILPLLEEQLAPPQHKFGGFGKPGRYREDLSATEEDRLAEAVSAWRFLNSTPAYFAGLLK